MAPMEEVVMATIAGAVEVLKESATIATKWGTWQEIAH